jgi:hypothetical protein
MRNELSDRQQAIRMRLAGDSVVWISQTLRRSEAWVRKWWQRYLAAGGAGLYDLTRARHTLKLGKRKRHRRMVYGVPEVAHVGLEPIICGALGPILFT